MLPFRRYHLFTALVSALLLGTSSTHASDTDSDAESRLISDARQLTFEGKRSGEGYFNADGSTLIFQSERDADNPFYQIFLMDLETGDVNRVSPGHGKTTCAWVHPSKRKVLFASTHGDPESKALQQAELDFRASGQTRRYSWDYDEHFEIYEANVDGSKLRNLTNALGYDAEGSYSPDGKWIAFASNRHAYSENLSAEDTELFERDKSYLMEIYIMRQDGSKLRRLTHTKGYDGGPFFSPDGKRITWRRFAPNGATAEIFTMNIDGSDVRQLTDVGAMSWAPYYHPSGDYLIFTNNTQGFGNFELFIVDSEGRKAPVRVTYTDGFDGLPVFSPDGAKIAWTTNRTTAKQSQIFLANWNDAKARELLDLDGSMQAKVVGFNVETTASAIRAEDMHLHIAKLASEEMAGRRTGTEGEALATAYVASVFEAIGLEPAGDDGTYYQNFEFTASVSMGAGSTLTLDTDGTAEKFTPDEDWRPLAFSQSGAMESAPIVFAGYGIQAPKSDDQEEYDSFVHLDVTNKWIMAFRYLPEDVTPEERRHLTTHSSLRFKAMTARDLGAAGLIIVSGPNSGVKHELVRLAFDTSLGSTSIHAISVTDATAQTILNHAGKDLKTLQDSLDGGEAMMGFPIPGVMLGGVANIEQEKRWGRNVLGRLNAAGSAGDTRLVVGAHVDHLGKGRTNTSLARDEEDDAIHYGADDNASGVSGMLEIAQYLVAEKAKGLELKRDIVFAAWSGEELGLLGAYHFVGHIEGKGDKDVLTPEISAYLNMDMIGRMGEHLIVQGVASSSLWPSEIERRNVPVGLSIIAQDESYLPTDAMAFYVRGVPFLNAFTGAHEDYHTPRDTVDKINFEGATKIARFMGLVARSLATREEAPDYLEAKRPENMDVRGVMRAYLGTIPDYADSDVAGVKLSGATKGGPADKAGLKMGDVIVELAGRKIENIYDYTFAIEALKIGETVKVVVERDGARISLEITPGSRE